MVNEVVPGWRLEDFGKFPSDRDFAAAAAAACSLLLNPMAIRLSAWRRTSSGADTAAAYPVRS